MTADRTQQQADTTSARVAALLAAYQAGQLDTPDMSRATAVAVFAGKLLASRLADITVSNRAGKPPVGVRPGEQHVARLEEAVTTIVDDYETALEHADDETEDDEPDDDQPDEFDPEPRLDRLARSEVEESHAKSLSAAIREQGYPEWREVVAEDACPICERFRDRVHSAEEAFERHHPRCRCHPEPVGEPVATVSSVLTFTSPVGGTS